jgi:hypothetical protein
MRCAVKAVPFLFAALCAVDAEAQTSGADIAAAQTLFDAGKQAMSRHDYAVACPKLAESFRLDPAGGTAFALALCHEADGKTASAWADFNQALALARRDHRTERETAAQEHITALEKRLVKLNIVVKDDVPSLEIRRDGSVVGRAQWGTAVPVDPGTHAIDARADKKKPAHIDVATGAEGSTVDVVIPPLVDDTSAATTTPPPPTASATPPSSSSSSGWMPPPPNGSQTAKQPPPPETPPADQGDSRKTWAYVAGGVGVAGLATGTVTGLIAMAKWSDAHKACPNNTCTKASDQSNGKEAGNFADVASVGFIVGGVGVIAATALFLTAPSSPEPKKSSALQVTPIISPTTLGIGVGGAL